MPRSWNDWSTLIVSLLVCQLAGVVGSIFTFAAIPLWYNALTLPSFTPPGWVFGPVWTLLYILMGIALYIVWRAQGGGEERARARKRGLYVFGIQLGLNALWSFLFFGLRSPLLGFFDIVLLLVFIILSIRFFYAVEKRAAYLLVPYLVWVVYATILNGAIMYLN